MRFLDKHGKKILRIFGTIVLLISIYLLVSGGICMWTYSTTRDSEGFSSTWTIQINKDSHAIVLNPENIDFGGGCNKNNLYTIKVKVSNNSFSNQIFVGIAREADIDAYLSGVEFDQITSFQIFPSRAKYQNYPGNIMPGSPSSQVFWIESTYGTGIQTLTLEPGSDFNSLVFMNENGSSRFV
jgi:hypothetical protein